MFPRSTHSPSLIRRDRTTVFDPATPPAWLAQHPQQCVLLSAWRQWRGERALPTRRDVDPLTIPSLLSHVVYLDAVDGDFRFRLTGEAINSRYGIRLKGKTMRQLMSGPALAEILHEHQRCIDEGRPVLVQNIVEHSTSGDMHAYVRLNLPIGDETGRAAHVIGVMTFQS